MKLIVLATLAAHLGVALAGDYDDYVTLLGDKSGNKGESTFVTNIVRSTYGWSDGKDPHSGTNYYCGKQLCTSKVASGAYEFAGSALADGGSGVRLFPDPETGEVRTEIAVSGGPDETRLFRVKDFRRWSPETPVVYTQRFEIASGDAVVETFGFRKVEFRKDGFYLNGVRRQLRGVNYHQDREGRGWAVTDDERAADIAAMKELGADAVRTAHYPHSGRTYALCDEAGLLAWCEQPNVNGLRFNDAFRSNATGSRRMTGPGSWILQRRN